MKTDNGSAPLKWYIRRWQDLTKRQRLRYNKQAETNREEISNSFEYSDLTEMEHFSLLDNLNWKSYQEHQQLLDDLLHQLTRIRLKNSRLGRSRLSRSRLMRRWLKRNLAKYL